MYDTFSEPKLHRYFFKDKTLKFDLLYLLKSFLYISYFTSIILLSYNFTPKFLCKSILAVCFPIHEYVMMIRSNFTTPDVWLYVGNRRSAADIENSSAETFFNRY